MSFTNLNNYGTGGTTVLYNGSNGPNTHDAAHIVGERDNEPLLGHNGTWEVVFTLDTSLPSNQDGYNLTEISTFAAWQDVRRNQRYTVEYQKTTDPEGTFNFLGTVAFTNLAGAGSSRVTWLDTAAGNPTGEFIATNVKAIRFSILDPTTYIWDGTFYREFDVIGVAIPEPSSGLLVLGGLLGSLLLRRRRR